MHRRTLTASLAATLLLALMVPAAYAVAPVTRVVDDDGLATIADCNAAAVTPYSTIQSAVDVSSATDTVLVCPGTYAEQVIVTVDNLKLRGAHAGQSAYGCVARSSVSRVTGAPASGTGAFWIKANKDTIDGFTIANNDGPGVQLGASWYGSRVRNNRITGNISGVYLQASGAARTYVNNNCISNNNNPGSATGNGIYSDAGLNGATIDHNSFRGHTNSGILLLGTGAGAVRNVTITGNTSFNDITFASLSDVQKVLVYGNTVTQDGGGPGGAGSAIRVGDFSGGISTQGVQVISNIITSPHFAGVAIREAADGVLVARNTIDGTDVGVDNTSTTAGAAVIRWNTITNVQSIGVWQEAGTSENLTSNNTISGSGVTACQDDTIGPDTYGLANSWRQNGCIPA